MTKSLNSII